MDLDDLLFEKQLKGQDDYKIEYGSEEYKDYVKACKFISKVPKDFQDVTLDQAVEDLKQVENEILFKINTKSFARFISVCIFLRTKFAISPKSAYKYTLSGAQKGLEDLKKYYEESNLPNAGIRLAAVEKRLAALNKFISKKGYEVTEEDAEEFLNSLDKIDIEKDEKPVEETPENV